MTVPLDALEPLPPEQSVALAWSAGTIRDRLLSLLVLDRRLGRILTRTREPMLGQMRFAWWREALGKPAAERPRSDAVLEALGEHWRGNEDALIALVDAWERLLEEPPLSEAAARAFAEGRCTALLAVYGLKRNTGSPAKACHRAASRWSFGDFAARVSDADERALLVRLGLADAGPDPRLPREARALAVLGALGTRGLRRGGRPLMEGRGASLAAIRAAIFLR